MPQFSIVDRVDYPNKPMYLNAVDIILTPLRIACGGRRVSYGPDERIDDKIHHIAIRAIAGLVTALISPIIILALAVKYCTQPKSEKKLEIKPDLKFKKILDTASKGPTKNYDEFKNSLKAEVKKSKHLDVKLGPPKAGSWRAAYAKDEEQELIEPYMKRLKNAPDKRPIVVQRLGQFNETQMRIISITSDFLKVFHNLPLTLNDSNMSIKELREKTIASEENEEYRDNLIQAADKCCPRENGQYKSDFILQCMNSVINKYDHEERGQQILGLTTDDLYSSGCSNFVFGTAQYGGMGILSNARFGDPTKSKEAFEKTLLRMMKITAHEFGHMRHISHCSDYECNIGGYMSLTELDARPLYFCMEDSAKICYLTHSNLLDYHKKLYKFFENFNQKYHLNIDLSKELTTLKNRITALNTNS